MARRITAVLFALALLFALSGCHTEEGGGAFRFPLSGEPYSLDPQLSATDAERTVAAQLFEGLAGRDGEGRLIPAAAEWTVSADGRTYDFTLRQNCWSDGSPVTAADFVFALERTRDPATRSPYAGRLAGVTAEAVSDTRLTVTLPAPDETFLSSLAEGAWYPCPRAFFEQCGGRWGMEADSLLTNGPFTLSLWEHGTSLLLRKNADWHRAAEVAPASLRYVIGAEEGAAALESGALDGCRLAAGESAPTVLTAEDTLTFLFFNTTLSPLDSAAFRRGLRAAVDWEAVGAALPGPSAVSYVPPAAEGFSSSLTAPRCDGDAAKEMLAAALTEKGLTACPTLTLLCREGEASLRLAQYIVQSWQKHLGVYFSVEQVSDAALAARLSAGTYHLASADATPGGPTPADALLLFDGEAGEGNVARYANPAWAAAVRAAGTPEALAAEEKALFDACPAVPLCAVTRRFGLAKGVSGVTVAPFTERWRVTEARRN